MHFVLFPTSFIEASILEVKDALSISLSVFYLANILCPHVVFYCSLLEVKGMWLYWWRFFTYFLDGWMVFLFGWFAIWCKLALLCCLFYYLLDLLCGVNWVDYDLWLIYNFLSWLSWHAGANFFERFRLWAYANTERVFCAEAMSNDLWGNFAFVLRDIDALCFFDAFELMLMVDVIKNGLI